MSSVSARTFWKWVHSLGMPGLIFLGFADNAPFLSAPAGSVDTAVILLAWHNPKWWAYYAMMATIGEVIGGYVTYLFSEKSGEMALEKKFGKAKMAKMYDWFQKRGAGLVVTVGAILPPPFPFTPVLMTAGVIHYPRSKFLASLVVGRSIRFLAEAYLGRRFGQAVIAFFARHYRPALYVLIVLAFSGGIAALIYFKWYRPRPQHEAHSQS